MEVDSFVDFVGCQQNTRSSICLHFLIESNEFIFCCMFSGGKKVHFFPVNLGFSNFRFRC